MRKRKDRLAKIAERCEFNYIFSFPNKLKRIRNEQKRKCKEQFKKFDKYLRCISSLGKIAEKHMSELVAAKSMSWSMITYNFDDLPQIYAVISYLLQHGFYRESILELRYSFESMIQAFYLDQRHPDVGTDIKMEILKEVEGKRDYYGKPLINAVKDITSKGELIELYNDLSSNLHPKHVEDTFAHRYRESTIDCERFSGTIDLMGRTFDAILFILMNACPDIKNDIAKNNRALTCLKNIDANLSLKLLNA